MARGLYRDNGGWVVVSYDGKFRFKMPMHRSDYDSHDYKPAFDDLPAKEKYEKAKGASRR